MAHLGPSKTRIFIYSHLGIVIAVFIALNVLIQLSYLTTKEVQRLKSRIQDLYIQNDVQIEYEGQIVSGTFMKFRMVEKLDNFNGFDGLGFFVLGRNSLLSALAIYASFLFVLMQFKVTEIC